MTSENQNGELRICDFKVLSKSISDRFKHVNKSEWIRTKRMKKKIKQIEIEKHALDRWNERVGPKTELNRLKEMFEEIFYEPDRIMFTNKEFGLIDNDIVFSYYIEKNLIKITTFYGRISIRPYLADIDALKKWSRVENENVDLSVEERVINKQYMPPMPVKTVYYKDEERKYKIEHYCNKDHDVKSYTIELDFDRRECFSIKEIS